jgi:hypothetical protein
VQDQGASVEVDAMQTTDNGQSQKHPRSAKGIHETSIAALKDVCGAYNDWSKGLTDTSLQMCLGLVAANWLVFGSVKGIVNNRWAMGSLFLVLSALACNLLGSYCMSEWFRIRIEYAESDIARWESEYCRYSGIRHAWPYTENIECASKFLRLTKMVLPLASGAAFIVAALK